MFCFLYLYQKVFPDLRVWCEKRRLHLVDCDLRWVSNHGNRQQLPQIRYQAYELTTLFLHLFWFNCFKFCPVPNFIELLKQKILLDTLSAQHK